MRINCVIDDKSYTMNVNADKPLNRILEERIDSFSVNGKCLGANCGNCIVLMNGSCVLSCLVPAFKLNNAKIQTFDNFSKTPEYEDIKKAYTESGIRPCRQCYASKTLLIESLIQRLEENRIAKSTARITTRKISDKSRINTGFSIELVAKEMDLNQCKCLEDKLLAKVIILAHQYRRKRRG